MIESVFTILSALTNQVSLPPPDPLGYPVPPWILQALSYLTLTLHLLAMNFVIGGSLLLLWARFRKKLGHEGAAYFLGSGLPLGVSYIITLGIPPLLFVQVLYGQLFYSSSILLGAFWIQVIPLVILAYTGFYYHKFNRFQRPRYQSLIIAVSVIFLLYVGYIYVSNLTLSMSPEKWLAMYAQSAGGGVLHHGEPSLHPRLLLFLSGAFAVAGLALIWRGAFLIRWGFAEEGTRCQKFGFRAFLISPVIWALAALGVYFTRKAEIQAMFNYSGATIILLIIGIVSALLAGVFAYLSIGKKNPLHLILSSLGIFGSMASMVIFRDLVRMAYLEPYFKLSSVPVNAQWGMFALFVITLVLGATFLIIYAIKVIPRIAEQSRERLGQTLSVK